MHYQLKTAELPKPSSKSKNTLNTVILFATQNDKTQAQIDIQTQKALPTAIQSILSTAIDSAHFTGAAGQSLSLMDTAASRQFIVLGVGKPTAKTPSNAGAALAQYSQQYELKQAHVFIDELFNEENALNAFILASEDATYTFTAPNGMNTGEHAKTNTKKQTANEKRDITLMTHKAPNAAQKKQLTQAVAIAQGVQLAKQLGNLPANYATPTHLGNTAKQLGKDYGFKVQVLEQKQIAALKMNSFLSVAKGSTEPPRFIVMEYKGAGAKDAPTVLVGKGITFDSGGISIKPGAGMDEMKYDMCGAASVLGTFKTLGELQPKINVVGLIATCENMPAGNANKPGDVVTSMAGLTIEILNTDAEGRLVLCDALTYAERYKPAAVVDMATLTGACVVALGHHHSGLFANDKHLADELQASGARQNDTVWQMPLDDAYSEQLKSNFADLANIGGMPAGSVTAACFLSKFANQYPWAHIDIAGTAWKSGANKGATGRPVPLLSQFLLNRAE